MELPLELWKYKTQMVIFRISIAAFNKGYASMDYYEYVEFNGNMDSYLYRMAKI